MNKQFGVSKIVIETWEPVLMRQGWPSRVLPPISARHFYAKIEPLIWQKDGGQKNGGQLWQLHTHVVRRAFRAHPFWITP